MGAVQEPSKDISKWRSSLVGRAQSTSRSTSSQISPKASWTLQGHKGLISYHLSIGTTTPMEDTRCVPFDLLTPYHETDIHGANFTQPPSDLVDGEEEYEVKEILDSRKHGRGRKVQYLVKWKGYPLQTTSGSTGMTCMPKRCWQNSEGKDLRRFHI